MSKKGQHLRDRVQIFFQKSEGCLNTAVDSDMTREYPATDRVCLECQACVEFALKSFLLSNQQEYRKYGHDLEMVLAVCSKHDPDFNQLKKICEDLMDYHGVTEYDLGEDAFPSIQEAEQCLLNARQVYEFVKVKLKDLGFLAD